jgi:hypothetical protein
VFFARTFLEDKIAKSTFSSGSDDDNKEKDNNEKNKNKK